MYEWEVEHVKMTKLCVRAGSETGYERSYMYEREVKHVKNDLNFVYVREVKHV